MFGNRIKSYFNEDNLFYKHKGKDGNIYFYTVEELFNRYSERTYQIEKNGDYHILISKDYLEKILTKEEEFDLLLPVLKNSRTKLEYLFLYTLEILILMLMFRVPLNIMYFIGLPKLFFFQLLLIIVLVAVTLFPFVFFNILHYKSRSKPLLKSELLLYGIDNEEIKNRLKTLYKDNHKSILQTRFLVASGERVQKRWTFIGLTVMVLVFISFPIIDIMYKDDSQTVLEYLEYRAGGDYLYYNYRYKINESRYVFSSEKEVETSKYILDMQECGDNFCTLFEEIYIYDKNFNVVDTLDFTTIFDIEYSWFELKEGIAFDMKEILNDQEEVIEKQVYIYDIVNETAYTFTTSKDYSIDSMVNLGDTLVFVGGLESDKEKTIVFEVKDMNSVTEVIVDIPNILELEYLDDHFYTVSFNGFPVNEKSLIKLDMDFNLVEELSEEIEYDNNIHIIEGEIYLKHNDPFEDYGFIYSLDNDLKLLKSYQLPQYSMGFDRTMSALYTGSQVYEFTTYKSDLTVKDVGLICQGCSEEFISAYFIIFHQEGDKLFALTEGRVAEFQMLEDSQFSFEYKESDLSKFLWSISSLVVLYGISVIYYSKLKDN